MNKIDLFQQHLKIFRRILGWTQKRLAHEIGLTPQTIVVIEKLNRPMTKIEYIAIRAVFDNALSDTRKHKILFVWYMNALVDDDRIRMHKELITESLISYYNTYKCKLDTLEELINIFIEINSLSSLRVYDPFTFMYDIS